MRRDKTLKVCANHYGEDGWGGLRCWSLYSADPSLHLLARSPALSQALP